MTDENVKPNTIVYSSAISACGAAGEWEAALGLLEQMRERRVPRNTIVYNAAIQARRLAIEDPALPRPSLPMLAPPSVSHKPLVGFFVRGASERTPAPLQPLND